MRHQSSGTQNYTLIEEWPKYDDSLQNRAVWEKTNLSLKQNKILTFINILLTFE